MKVTIKNAYGFDIELDAELSDSTKEAMPCCVACWEDSQVMERESFYCNHYGPCNFYPLLKGRE